MAKAKHLLYGLAKGSESCVRYEKSNHPALGAYPCVFKNVYLDVHTALQTRTMLFSY